MDNGQLKTAIKWKKQFFRTHRPHRRHYDFLHGIELS